MQDPILTPLFIAGLETVGVTGGITIGTSTVSYASILSAATVLAGSAALSYALSPSTSAQSQNGNQTLKQTIPPRIGVYGRNRIGGSYMCYEVTSDGRSVDIIAMASGLIGGFVTFYLHDDPVVLSGNLVIGGARSGSGVRYANAVRIASRRGFSTESYYPEAVSVLPGIWTENHRGDGTASALMMCTSVSQDQFLKVFPQGLPMLSAVLDGFLVYDPRDPTQDRAVPTSCKISSNPVIQLLDFLTHPDHGMGMDWDRRIQPVLTKLIARANLCDNTILTEDDDPERRYQSALDYNFDTDPAATIADILAACDGWIALDGNGHLALEVGVYQPDDSEAGPITSDHILSVSVDYGVADQEKVNELVLAYVSPDQDYRTVAGDPWRDEESIALRGQTRSQPFNLKAVQSHRQLRELARRTMLRLNAPLRGSMVTQAFGMTKQGLRWVDIDAGDVLPEFADAVIEVSKFEVNHADHTCSFDWVIVDPDVLDPGSAVDEGAAPPSPPPSPVATLLVPDNLDAFVVGSGPSEQYQVSFDDLERPSLTYVVRYRLQDDGSSSPPVPGDWQQQNIVSFTTDAGRTTFLFSAAVLVGQDFDVEVASRGVIGTTSDWSDTFSVSA